MTPAGWWVFLIAFCLGLSCGDEEVRDEKKRNLLSDCTKLSGSATGVDNYCCSFCESWTNLTVPARTDDGTCIVLCNSCMPEDVARDSSCAP